MSEPKYKYLAYSGGSVKGIAHIGATKRLVEANLIDFKKLKAVAGASAGALFSVLIVAGFSIDEIWDFMYNSLDLSKMVNIDPFLFLTQCGIESGQKIYDLYSQILEVKTGIKKTNFQQLYEVSKIHLIIVGTSLTAKKAIYYDHINTPTFEVALALRISISMPGFFTPIVIDGEKYIDGAILDHFPLHLFKDHLDEAIGFNIMGDYDTTYQYPEQFFVAIMNLFMYRYFDNVTDRFPDNTISIKGFETIGSFDFNLTNSIKKTLYQHGYNTADEFLKKN